MSLGIYISVPFCRTKCSFCNFASGVFSLSLFDRYVEQTCVEIEAAKGRWSFAYRLHPSLTASDSWIVELSDLTKFPKVTTR